MHKCYNVARLSRGMLVLLLLALALLPASAPLPGTQALSAPPAPTQDQQPAVDSLPLAVQYAFSSDLGRDDAAYHLKPDGSGGYAASNRGAGLAATFRPSGMEVRAGADTWSLALSGWGRGSDLRPVPAAGPAVADANRLAYTHGLLTAWYANGPLGLQQGWTLAERLAGVEGAPLTLALTQSGSLRGEVDDIGRELALADAAGASPLRYGGLLAYDAAGRALPAWFEADGERVLVRVDDAGATYPVVVDPWLQASKLTTSHGADGDLLGYALAVSEDGGTVVAGAPYHDAGGVDRGAVYVYTRPGEWATTPLYTARLTAGDGADGDLLAWSVAVSADGGTVVAGAPWHNAGGSERGAAYVFVRPPGGWVDASYTARLTAGQSSDGDRLGTSVAVSADGSTVVAGAYLASGGTNRGAAYVYTLPPGGWATTSQAAKLTAGDGGDGDNLGYAVAVSGDGGIVVAGAPYHNAGGVDRGAAYVYVRPPGGWTTNATHSAKLTAGDGIDADHLGQSVAVSGDGSTVIAGAPDNAAGGTYRGAAYVYVMPPGGWATTAAFGAKLTAADGIDADHLGQSVAVSGDGGTVLAGAPWNDAGGVDRGAAYAYVRPPSGWATTATFAAKLTAANGADDDRLGLSVALSGDGGTVVTGAYWHDAGGSDRGAAYVHVRPPSGWVDASHPAKLTASDGADDDRLGWSVALSGDGGTVVAGAHRNAAGGINRGAAYVYLRPPGGWAATAAFSAKLTARDGADYDGLGYAVAVSGDGDTVVAGAPQNAAGGSNRGAAYVYLRPPGGWATTATFAAKLTAGADNEALGPSVAVSDDGSTVVAGAPGHNAGGVARGAAYVYVRPPGGWATTAAFSAKLTARDGADEDNLGSCVAVSGDGDTVVASAPYHGAGGLSRGAAYVYVRPPGGWATTAVFKAKLTASDGADFDDLGWSVALSGDGGTVVAGAPAPAAEGQEPGVHPGAAYVYVRPPGGWATATETAKLTAADGADDDWLGESVAVSGDGGTVVAGAHRNAAGGINRGAAYVFDRPPGGWLDASHTAKLTAGDGGDWDWLGYAVAVSGDGGTVVAGAPMHSILTEGALRGAAYVFTLLLAPPQFTSGPPPSPAKAGLPYGFTFVASGHPAPAFSVTGGALPPALNLDGATGLLSGTPAAPGRYTFTVTASNGVPPDATLEATIDVVVAVYLPLVLRGAGGLGVPLSP